MQRKSNNGKDSYVGQSAELRMITQPGIRSGSKCGTHNQVSDLVRSVVPFFSHHALLMGKNVCLVDSVDILWT